MNTLTAAEMRRIVSHLDDIRELTSLLRRAHFDVPYETVYGAVGGEASIRKILLGAAISDVVVEPMLAEAAE